MTSILLDTHVFLWLQTEPERLGERLVLAEDPGNELLLSAASSWEISIKCALGKLPLPEAPARYVVERARRSGVSLIDVSHGDALAVAELPPHHRDPFDRLLVARAIGGGHALMTADPAIAAYDVDVIALS